MSTFSQCTAQCLLYILTEFEVGRDDTRPQRAAPADVLLFGLVLFHGDASLEMMEGSSLAEPSINYLGTYSYGLRLYKPCWPWSSGIWNTMS